MNIVLYMECVPRIRRGVAMGVNFQQKLFKEPMLPNCPFIIFHVLAGHDPLGGDSSFILSFAACS